MVALHLRIWKKRSQQKYENYGFQPSEFGNASNKMKGGCLPSEAILPSSVQPNLVYPVAKNVIVIIIFRSDMRPVGPDSQDPSRMSRRIIIISDKAVVRD